MVHFAVSSMFFHEYPLDEVFDYVEGAGFDGIEFWMETPHFWVRGCPLPELVTCARSHYQLTALTMHAPVLDLNPCSINPRVAKASCHYAVEALEMAEQVGAEAVTLHPGRRTVRRIPSGQEYSRFEQFISILREGAAGKKVEISIENMEPAVNALLCTPDAVRELLDRESWLHFTLDLSHAMAASRDVLNRYLDTCLDRLVNVHISRAENGRLHLPAHETGEVASVLRELSERGYNRNLTLEIEDRNFTHDLSLEERLTLLHQELSYLHEAFG